MIWRLTYCNKEGVEARLDIIKGSSTPVEVIEGTATPFALNYKMDKPDKSGFFMTSSADISIFETTSFNIDSLKTSSETEIKVEHYINNILDWSGFVIPDFFSKTIGSPATVEMVASDRLATLKGVTLTDLNQYISMRDLAVACLAHTGLSLPLYTLADFGNDGQTNAFFKALGLSSRLSDTKGRNISCYDILKSILVASNSKLVQQDGAWHIVNKWQHEQGVGNLFSNLTSSTPYSEKTINFSDVHVGGRRSIIPVAAITGVYHEFGGGRSYPDNFDFRDFGVIPEFNFPNWTKGGTFNVTRGNKEIIGYSFDGQMQFGANTVDNYFFNSNVFNTSNYLQMDGIPVPYATGQIEVVLDLNATAQTVSQFLTNVTAVKIAVGAVKDGSPTIWLNNNGLFAEDNAVIHNLNFERGATYQAQTKGFNLKGVINNPEGYSIIMRIYGSRDEGEDNRRQIAIHFARIEFKNTQDSPKGTIYKRRQGTDFTKEHDIDTTIFGDYMQKGLDGYFYEYPFDDTSSLYRTAGTLTQPLWTAPNDAEQLPLLQHVTRQKSRMFSLAHNMISARINVSSFKPLNIFIDCNSERYVVVSATYDFLRSEVEVELEQIAYATLNVRDFIYSYFGDSESGISSVGGISGGGGGGSTGGGLTPEQLEILSFWKKDPDNPNTIFTEMNAYSKLELSAYGAGTGGGGGGGIIETVYGYDNLGQTFNNNILTDTFNAYTINQINTRLVAVENGSATTVNTTGTGNAITSISKAGSVITANKDLTFLETSIFNTHNNDNVRHITGAERTKWDKVVTDFDELEIGGRNLWTNSRTTPATVTVVQYGYVSGYKNISELGLKTGELITFSVYVSNIPAGERVQVRIDFLRPDGTYSIVQNTQYSISNEGVIYVSTFVPDTSEFDRIRYRVFPANYTADYQVDVVHEKLERGNKATDWTPAPEDVQAAIDLKANIASPTFTGTVTAPSLIGTNANFSTQVTVGSSLINSPKINNWDEVRTWWQDVGQYLKRDATNQALYTDENFYSTKEVSAYGVGSGGGSGGGIIETVYDYSKLGQSFNNATLTDTFNAYTINQINTRLVAVENGSATTVNTTGTGNAITSISKAGSVITANKDLTFLETSIFNTHNNDNVRHITGAERTKWDKVVTDFAGLEIGGRNYALGSQLGGVITQPIGINLSETLYGVVSISVIYEVLEGEPIGHQVRTYPNLNTNGQAVYHQVLNANIKDNVFRIEIDAGVLGVRSIGLMPGYNNNDNGVVTTKVSYLKVEKGNKATDWTPAPEDQVSDWNTTDVNSFSFIKNKPTSLSQFTDNIGVATHIANKTNPHNVTKAQVGLGNVDNTADSAKNVLSATKLQTARTIAGVSFDGTASIAIPFANLSNKPTTLGEYGITDAVTLNTPQTITGDKIFEGGLSILSSYSFLKISRIGMDNTLLVGTDSTQNAIYSRDSGTGVRPLRIVVGTTEVMRFSNDYNVGIGTTSPSQKLHVVGNILATGTTTTTKVIFNSAGWSMEQTGTELLLKYNNLIAARFLADGSIVGLGEITAYGATTGGEGVSLLRTGGTMTGNLTMSADIIMNSGRAIGKSNLPLKLLGNALTYNASNVLTEANTATQIKMGNGWTIEQTTSALTIRKNGVVKGTFNA